VPARDQSIAVEIAQLRSLDLEGLRARWRSVFGRRAPAHLSRHLLFRIVAYRVQEDRLGGLKQETIRLLDQLANSVGSGGAGQAPVSPRQRDVLRAGTVLVREWKGNRHHVMTTATGFSWNGRDFDSLSEVAHAITGTRWSGPRFFGLRDSQKGQRQ
jgi:hypothetical protein